MGTRTVASGTRRPPRPEAGAASAPARPAPETPVLETRSGAVSLSHVAVMGIPNATPDSIADGGAHLDPARAADEAARLVADRAVAEVQRFPAERSAAARAAGVEPAAVVFDPGIGFGKTTAHNCALLRHLDDLAMLGYPVVVGVSRKGFLGELLGGRAVGGRLFATAAAVTLAVSRGARIVRVHDVGAIRDVVTVAEALLGRDPA